MNHSWPVPGGVALPKPTLAGGGRLAWSIVSGYCRLLARVAAVTTAGLAINWTFLVWQFGPALRLDLSIIFVIVFGVAFPAVYLALGHKQGVQVLLRHCYQRHESSLIDALLLILQRLTTVADDSQNPLSPDNIRRVLKRIDEMPWVMRFALKHCLRRLPLQALALEIIVDPDFCAGQLAGAKKRYGARINDCILADILDVETRTLRILVCVNACALLIAWLLLR